MAHVFVAPHPDDVALLEGETIGVPMVADKSMQRGCVRLETADGWVEDGPDVRLSRLRAQLAASPAFDAGALESVLKTFAESEGVGFGKFGPALRGILTGGAPAPDLNKTMAALAREESLARLDDALASRA